MSSVRPLSGPGRVYRGNLHAHTTRSDGTKTPEALCALYREAGYDFLAITDHVRYNLNDWGSPSDFLVLPGTEQHLNYAAPDGRTCSVHLIAVGPKANNGFAQDEYIEPIKTSDLRDVQATIDALAARGNLVILAHPVWSRMEAQDIVPLTGLTGIEIYNSVCESHGATGQADAYWDYFSKRGRQIHGVACDDTHRPENALRGWICVKAAALTDEAILEGIARGRFYASQGPKIYDYALEGRTVSIRCSPARAVYLHRYPQIGMSVYAERGRPLRQATFELDRMPQYMRLIVEDARGGRAYTNPIFCE